MYNTAHSLVEEIDFQNMTTALSLTEQLYTARGSQSAGQGSMLAERINVKGDSEKTFLLEQTSPIRSVRYQLRSLFQTSVFQGFTMTGLQLGADREQALLVGLPYYA